MRIQNPPVKLSIEIIEFLYEFSRKDKQCRLDTLKKHFKLSAKYMETAISFLVNTKIVYYPNAEAISLSQDSINQLGKSIENSRKLVLDKFMETQPFIDFTYYLSKGKSEMQSIRLVTGLYNLSQSESVLLGIFREWIKILEIHPAKNIEHNKTIEGLRDSFQSKLHANNFVKEYLGDDLKNISSQVITHLTQAIKDISTDNESSVNEAGRALEDFLRMDLAPNVNLTGCSGIGEIGMELNKYNTIYPSKLNSLCIGLSNIRSMGKAHGLDKILKLSWSVTDHGALGYIITILSLIKSYLTYKNEGKLVY